MFGSGPSFAFDSLKLQLEAISHFVGSILHYNDPNQDLKDLYFISPSWVCRLMSKVITVNAAHNFIPEGILHVNDIRHILGERNEEFPNRFYEKYTRLLNR